MEKNRIALYERLNDKNNCEDYIPVIETNKGHFMILESKIAKCSRESRRRYESYLESKGSERFDKLVNAVKADSEKKKGIWFDLKGFTDKLEERDIELIRESIGKYN